jgi:hypothetical protein
MYRVLGCIGGVGAVSTYHATGNHPGPTYFFSDPPEKEPHRPTYEQLEKNYGYLEEDRNRLGILAKRDRKTVCRMTYVGLIAIPGMYIFGRWGGFPKLRIFIGTSIKKSWRY